MPEPLLRLIYGSENHLRGPDPEIVAELDQIMACSRRNNEAAGITGALLFTGATFTQVLEGPRAEVELTFERISQDIRHGGVMLIDLHPCQERAFASWSMTLLDSRDWSGSDRLELDRLGGVRPADPAAGAAVVELLRRFLVQRMVLGQPAGASRAAPPSLEGAGACRGKIGSRPSA